MNEEQLLILKLTSQILLILSFSRQNLRKCKYLSREEFLEHASLIVSNSVLYNGESSVSIGTVTGYHAAQQSPMVLAVVRVKVRIISYNARTLTGS